LIHKFIPQRKVFFKEREGHLLPLRVRDRQRLNDSDYFKGLIGSQLPFYYLEKKLDDFQYLSEVN
jgi:hypothetical protein